MFHVRPRQRKTSQSWFPLALVGFCWLPFASADDALDPAKARTDPDGSTLWYDAALLGVEGKGWPDTKAPYDRLPAKAEGSVRPPVWKLSRDSAGLCVRFVTDAASIRARWMLTGKDLAMPRMTATGVSGLDLYVRTENRALRWLAAGRPAQAPTNTAVLAEVPGGVRRDSLLYLPLYNGVTSVEVGLPKGAALFRSPPPAGKPVVFYGPSITQGGCASRPGMVHTAILGRRLGVPVINLGFSGNGKMEPELAALLAELDPSVYVLDCLPNLQPSETAERVEPFVRTLRKAHPGTPIVLVEDRNYSDGHLVATRRERNEGNHAALRKAFDRMAADGVKGLHYLAADGMLGDDGEGTVDGSHPTDLGFARQADAFEKVLRPLLP